MRRPIVLLACLCAASLLAGDSVAGADVFGPIQLASIRPITIGSTSALQQAASASQPAISADGRYVAFVATFGGVQGVWRRDVSTGAVAEVAPGFATRPSISEDGRYVSFNSAVRLNPDEDKNEAPDVYVRDMEASCGGEGAPCTPCKEHQEAEGAPCPFVLVSARNGSSEGPTYEYNGSNGRKAEEERTTYGASAAGRTAMSANGKLVVFETTAESNLVGPHTPAREVLLRDLETRETRLVSAEYEPAAGRPANGEDVPVQMNEGYGAAYLGEGQFGSLYGGASISADGSTVAWMAQDVERQAQLLAGEQARVGARLTEPLWRRVADGPTAPIRRVTGGSDPTNPRCLESGEQTLPSPATLADPCWGPFELNPLLGILGNVTKVDFVPQLSEHGETVAFLASAREVASGQELLGAENTDDLYVVDMSEGLTRVQALRRLTEISSGNVAEISRSGQINDLAVSADGQQVSFSTGRTLFPLGVPVYVSPPAAREGMSELFDVDLSNGTLTRVTHGFEGEDQPSEARLGSPEKAGQDPYNPNTEGAFSPSFSADGNLLSFSSTADNLVYGDGNGGPDAFVVARQSFPAEPIQQTVSQAPANPTFGPEWRLGATVSPQPDGSVLLYVDVPGAGRLTAQATGAVPVAASTASRSRHAGRARRANGARRGVAVAARNVAATSTTVSGGEEGIQTLRLSLKATYRSLAARAGGLYTTIAIGFTAQGHPDLKTTISVSFHRTARASSKRRAAGARRRAPSHGGSGR